MSNSLRLQHARLPCSSPTPGACSNLCPSSRWCHPTISSSVIPFFSHLQSFPASGSFPMSWFFASGGQSIGVSASIISPSNEYSGLISFRIDWFYLFANFQETLKNHLQHHSSKALILQHLAFFMIQLPHPYMTTGSEARALHKLQWLGALMRTTYLSTWKVNVFLFSRGVSLILIGKIYH